MGYKLAGFDVVAANDIDPKMKKLYVANLQPPHYFICPIRELLDYRMPFAEGELDVLDGSPPCTTFSVAGRREADWGKARKFKEGNCVQVLDDLFFDYLKLVEKIRPRVFIAENVRGMLVGKARGYIKQIVERAHEAGYNTQVFSLNAKFMNVPQSRTRLFFVGARRDLNYDPLRLKFEHPIITVSEALNEIEVRQASVGQSARMHRIWFETLPGDSFVTANRRLFDSNSLFNMVKVDPLQPAPTVTPRHCLYHWHVPRYLTVDELKRLSSFPDDYRGGATNVVYACGMSVPPRMMECISREVHSQWFA
jgi:DNA (cytosine-5)-methyltransferase 1